MSDSTRSLLSDSPSHLAQLQDPEAGSNLAHSGGYSIVTSTVDTFRVQTRHSMSNGIRINSCSS